jgi:hypothetical protein
MPPRPLRLSHGWKLVPSPGFSGVLLREFIRPAVRALPAAMARRLGFCRISLLAGTEPDVASQWTETSSGLEVALASAGVEDHDLAMELLLCLGQALWGTLSESEVRTFWAVLDDEIREGVTGEIDEQALAEKRSLLSTLSRARSQARLERYGCASFAGTAAEYVHCLWHEVTIRSGAEYLPPGTLRRRLDLLARWFPPDRAHRLYPPSVAK